MQHFDCQGDPLAAADAKRDMPGLDRNCAYPASLPVKTSRIDDFLVDVTAKRAGDETHKPGVSRAVVK
jgi:hypothetical protein